MIEEAYVSFETAKLLKEKGFDKYPLFPCYKEDNGAFIDIPTTLDTINYCFIPAPTLQMAMRWLREVHNIDITALPQFDSSKWTYSAIIFKLSIPCTEIRLNDNKDKKEEAYEAACIYALKNLI